MIAINGPIRIYNEFFYVSHNDGKNTLVFSFTCSPTQSSNYADCRIVAIPILGKITSVSSYHIHNSNAITDIFSKFNDVDVNANLNIYKSNLQHNQYLEWVVCSLPDKIQQKAIEMWSDDAVFPNVQAVEWLNYINKGEKVYSFLIVKIPYSEQILSFPPIEINYDPYPVIFNDPQCVDDIDDDYAFDDNHKYHYVPLFNNGKPDGIHRGIPNFNDISDHNVFIALGRDIDNNDENFAKYVQKYNFTKINVLDVPSSIKEYASLIKIINERSNTDIIIPAITIYQMGSFSLSYIDQMLSYGYDVPDIIIHNYIRTNLTWLRNNVSEEGFIKIPLDLSNGKFIKNKQQTN